MGSLKNISVAVIVAALATFAGAGIATAAGGAGTAHPATVHLNGTLAASRTPVTTAQAA